MFTVELGNSFFLLNNFVLTVFVEVVDEHVWEKSTGFIRVADILECFCGIYAWGWECAGKAGAVQTLLYDRATVGITYQPRLR